MAKNKQAAEQGNGEQNAVKEDRRARPDDKNIVNVVWDFLSSMKLGIVLLLVIALVSIIGTINEPENGDWASFYNSWVFRILLGLLALNLLICSLNRWKSIVNTLKGPGADFSENFVKNLKGNQLIGVKADAGETAQQVRDLLKRRGYRTFAQEEEGVYKVSSDRGHFGILGPYLTHLSFLVMIVALIIKFSNIVGFDGTVMGQVGQTINLSQGQNIYNLTEKDYFEIKIDNFRTEFRPNSEEVKQWYSDVSVIENGQVVKKDSIYVNHPLVYNGVKFYQMSYDHVFYGTASGPQATNQQFSLQKQQQGYIQPAGSDVAFVPTGYDNFDVKNARIVTNIYKSGQFVRTEEIPENKPFKYENAEITYSKVDSVTVLSAKRDPGLLYAGAGSLLLIVGVMISFLFRQRRIWSVVKPEKDGAVVQIGGISAKDKRSLDEDIEHIAAELK